MNEIQKADKEKLEVESREILTTANCLVITSEADNAKATAFLTVIKGAQKKIDATFKPMIDAAKNALAVIKTERAKYADPLDAAEDSLRARMGEFLLAETKRREALQAKEDAKFLKAAEKAAKTGKPMTVAPNIVAPVSAAQGATISKRYYAEVIDIKVLCAAVASGMVDPEYVLPNQVLLNRLAVALKESFKVPGAVAKYEISTTIRGA